MTRITLADPRQKATTELPSFPGSKIVYVTEALVGDIRQGMTVTNTYEELVALLKSCIVEWNFDKEDGTPAPIEEEFLAMLPKKDLDHLLERISGKTMDELQKIGVQQAMAMDKKKELKG